MTISTMNLRMDLRITQEWHHYTDWLRAENEGARQSTKIKFLMDGTMPHRRNRS